MTSLAIGRLGRPFGVRGFLYVDSYSGTYAHFSSFSSCVLRKEACVERFFEVETFKTHRDKGLILFKGISSPELAKTLVGFDLWVSKRYAAPLEEGEVYLSQLIGLRCFVGEEERGYVSAYFEGALWPLLEICVEEKRFLVPFRHVFINSVSIEQQRINLSFGDLLE